MGSLQRNFNRIGFLFAAALAGKPFTKFQAKVVGMPSDTNCKYGDSKHHNKSNTAKHKWDLVQSTGAGAGTFRNRTTGETKYCHIDSVGGADGRQFSKGADRHFNLLRTA